MNPNVGIDALPGQTQVADQKSYAFLKNADHKIERGVIIDDASRDVGNTGETYKLRPGLVLVRVEAAGANQGKYVPLDHTDAPIDANILQAGVLYHLVDMRDKTGASYADKGSSIITHGEVDEDQTWWSGANAARIAAAKAKMAGVWFVAAP